MSACPAEELITELVEGSLPAESAAELHRHVRGCRGCRLILAGLADSQPGQQEGARDEGPSSIRFEPGAQLGRFASWRAPRWTRAPARAGWRAAQAALLRAK